MFWCGRCGEVWDDPQAGTRRPSANTRCARCGERSIWQYRGDVSALDRLWPAPWPNRKPPPKEWRDHTLRPPTSPDPVARRAVPPASDFAPLRSVIGPDSIWSPPPGATAPPPAAPSPAAPPAPGTGETADEPDRVPDDEPDEEPDGELDGGADGEPVESPAGQTPDDTGPA